MINTQVPRWNTHKLKIIRFFKTSSGIVQFPIVPPLFEGDKKESDLFSKCSKLQNVTEKIGSNCKSWLGMFLLTLKSGNNSGPSKIYRITTDLRTQTDFINL